MIHTKLHEALDVARHGMNVPREGTTLGDAIKMLEEMAQLPHYVMGRDLLDKLKLEPLATSMSALHTAGVMRLPFPDLALELWDGEPQRRLLAVVSEGAYGKFKVAVVEWSRDTEQERISVLVRIDLTWNPKLPPTSPGESYPPRTARIEDSDTGQGWDCTYSAGEAENDPGVKSVLYSVSIGVMLAVLNTNIAGLEREVVDVKALNKARAKSGKRAIPGHTLVRIGHVYNSSGQRVKYERGDGRDRKPTIVHMRAAHTRRQQHGPAFLESEEGARYRGLPTTTDTHHVVFIDAVLVNYRDGTDLAKPLPKVVKF